jgi:Holliday junction resolvase RusA-like endonuclease
VFKDDSQVAFAKITKRYAETARVEIMIEELVGERRA